MVNQSLGREDSGKVSRCQLKVGVAAAADDDLLRWRRLKENPLLAAGTNGIPGNVNGGLDGCMSLPRITRLDDDNLLQTPAPELEKLRGESLKVGKMVLVSESKAILGAKGDTIEVIAEFEAGDARAFGLKLRCSEDGNSALVIRHDREKINVAGTDVPAPLGKGSRRLKLHAFLDKSVMEVFVNDGRACVTRVVYPGRNDLGLEVFAEGGRATLLSLNVWQMTSIW